MRNPKEKSVPRVAIVEPPYGSHVSRVGRLDAPSWLSELPADDVDVPAEVTNVVRALHDFFLWAHGGELDERTVRAALVVDAALMSVMEEPSDQSDDVISGMHAAMAPYSELVLLASFVAEHTEDLMPDEFASELRRRFPHQPFGRLDTQFVEEIQCQFRPGDERNARKGELDVVGVCAALLSASGAFGTRIGDIERARKRVDSAIHRHRSTHDVE